MTRLYRMYNKYMRKVAQDTSQDTHLALGRLLDAANVLLDRLHEFNAVIVDASRSLSPPSLVRCKQSADQLAAAARLVMFEFMMIADDEVDRLKLSISPAELSLDTAQEIAPIIDAMSAVGGDTDQVSADFARTVDDLLARTRSAVSTLHRSILGPLVQIFGRQSSVDIVDEPLEVEGLQLSQPSEYPAGEQDSSQQGFPEQDHGTLMRIEGTATGLSMHEIISPGMGDTLGDDSGEAYIDENTSEDTDVKLGCVEYSNGAGPLSVHEDDEEVPTSTYPTQLRMVDTSIDNEDEAGASSGQRL